MFFYSQGMLRVDLVGGSGSKDLGVILPPPLIV